MPKRLAAIPTVISAALVAGGTAVLVAAAVGTHRWPLPTVLTAVAALVGGLVMWWRGTRARLEAVVLSSLPSPPALAAPLDELSGLLHRQAITAELARATETGPGSLLIIDIDRFRDLNQYLGHACADDVLRQLGSRLARSAGPGERLGRLGADEFALVTPNSAPAEALATARRVRDLVEVPFQVGGGDLVRLDLSVGIVSWDQNPPRVDQLLSQAHEARRLARAQGLPMQRWDPDRDSMATRRLALADALRRSVRREELQLYYQPKVHLGTGEVVGVEALARWQHEGEMISPELFVSMAEEAGLIASLTRGLLDQALGQVARWDAQGLRLSVSVNLSPRNLLDPALPRRVSQLLERHGIAPRRLVLEITETTLMPDRTRSGEVLERLRASGVRLSIDDYGTGNAALNYLRDFSVDELKLDRSYVAAMVSDERTFAIVASTVAMGRRLGLDVVAEGVERIEEVDALIRCGCEIIQGYLVCPPVPPAELTAWLRDNARSSRADPPSPNGPRLTDGAAGPGGIGGLGGLVGRGPAQPR
ncbi:MAG: putative bifunctional diguanylate cyclase/phosphodiesterase [Acidimicrobiales bacterium]